MRFEPPLVKGTFLKRYKRFFADVEVDGEVQVTHCPNTGSLRGCLAENAPALIQPVDNPSRKLRWTWKMIELDGGWVGVDTGIAVPLVGEAIASGLIPELGGYERCIPEVPYGEQRSRIDLLLSRGGEPLKSRGKRVLYEGDERVYVEVKNTTLTYERDGRRVGAFPDAVTARGLKHLEELMHMVDQGHRAAMVFSLQRNDCEAFVPADEIDPAYAKTFRVALKHGVEAYALAAETSPEEIRFVRQVPIEV